MNVFVIPAFNEELNIPRLLCDLEGRPELWEGGYVILVDDGSTDATVEQARAHPGDLPLIIVPQVRNQGPGRAFDRGFRMALELCDADDFVITMESDTTSDLDALTAMLECAREGADVVLASLCDGAELVNVAKHRRALSHAASFVIRRGSGLDARTVSSFFRVYRVSALRDAYAVHGEDLIREPGFACKAEILIKLDRLGATIAEVPVSVDWSRREGESKLRVLPTVRGYARVMARQATAKGRAT
jgi:dolichol-phosphate mannosyltransferase